MYNEICFSSSHMFKKSISMTGFFPHEFLSNQNWTLLLCRQCAVRPNDVTSFSMSLWGYLPK